jgi:hypothetical protein
MSITKKAGSFATALATVATLLTTSWGVIVSAAVGLATALWTGALEFFQRTEVQYGIGMFFVSLWTYIGLSTILSRRRPRLVRSFHDYRYGLTLEGCAPVWDADPTTGGLQMNLAFRNYTQGALKFLLQHVDIRLGTRALQKATLPQTSGLISRGGAKLVRAASFNMEDIKEYIGKRVEGTAEFYIAYGPADGELERIFKVHLGLQMLLAVDGKVGYADGITLEVDEDYSPVK